MSRLLGSKRSYGVTAIVITHNLFDRIETICCEGSFEAVNLIAEWAHEFEDKHQDTNWEDAEDDYETTVVRWTRGKILSIALRSEALETLYADISIAVDDAATRNLEVQ